MYAEAERTIKKYRGTDLMKGSHGIFLLTPFAGWTYFLAGTISSQ